MESILNTIWKMVTPFNCSFVTPILTPRPKLLLPDLPLELWLEIFQFATYVHQHATIVPLDPFTTKRVSTNVMGVNTPSLSIRTKLSLVLVCRAWRRAALQMLYEHVVIKSPARASAILAVLQHSARFLGYNDSGDRFSNALGYGQWTRHIEIYTHTRGADDIRYLQIIFQIFRTCPSLRILSGTWNYPLPIEFLKAISILYGPSLHALYWNECLHSPTVTNPEFLGTFQSLRALDLHNYVGHDLPKIPDTPLQTPTLPKVRDLIISAGLRSLRMATLLSLPALCNLTIKKAILSYQTLDFLTAFLKAHGSSLINVDLLPSADSEPDLESVILRRTTQLLNPDTFLLPDFCPNLVTLTFPTNSPPLGAYVHHSLRRIGLRGVKAEALYPDRATNVKTHLLSFTPDRFPNLEVVRTIGFLVDADADSLIKDVFIWWVEKFEQKGVDFLDGEGVLWAY